MELPGSAEISAQTQTVGVALLSVAWGKISRMVSYLAYKVAHLAGIFLVLMSLGGIAVLGPAATAQWKKRLAILNGIGLLVALVAGFGLLARLGASWPWQGWVFLKVAIWALLGGLSALAGRSAGLSNGVWWAAFLAAVVAAYLANYKPF